MRYALVAQLDRVTGYEPVGQGFESLPAYHLTGYPIRDNLLNFYVRMGLERAAQPLAGQKLRTVEQFLDRGRVHRRRSHPVGMMTFFYLVIRVSRTSVARRGWTQRNLNFRLWRKCKRVRSPAAKRDTPLGVSLSFLIQP